MPQPSPMPSPARLAALLALGAGLAGCAQAFGTADAHQPGELLGTYHVTATRTQNSCGEGALGTTPSWEFDVKLARDSTTLFWNNGAQVISGAAATDGTSFQIDADVVMNMRAEGDNGPPCSVNRHDRATVLLSASGTNVASFTGTLAYAFAPTSGSDCTDLIQGGSPNPKDVPVFAQLPCSFSYAMSASRTMAP